MPYGHQVEASDWRASCMSHVRYALLENVGHASDAVVGPWVPSGGWNEEARGGTTVARRQNLPFWRFGSASQKIS